MASIQRSTTTLAPRQTHAKLLCSRFTSIQEGTRIYRGLPIPVCPREPTTQAYPAHLDTRHIIQTHIPTANVRHSLLRGPPIYLLLRLERDVPNALNHPLPSITMSHNWMGPTRCPLDRLAQPIQTFQDLPEATRSKRDHHWRPIAIRQSLL
jgi:hypothetical protein